MLEKYREAGGVAFPDVVVPTRLGNIMEPLQVFNGPAKSTSCWEAFTNASFEDMLRRVGLVRPPKVIPDIVKRRQDGECPVMSMGWHPVLPILAVVLANDLVYFFDMETERWMDSLFLQHEYQQGALCLKWRPRGASSELAVGSSRGLCLWSMQCSVVALQSVLTSTSTMKSSSSSPDRYASAWMRFFDDEDTEAGPISSVEFSPDGYWLASARQKAHAIYVWDVVSGHKIRLDHSGGGTALAWSPDGTFLIGGNSSNVLLTNTSLEGEFCIWSAGTWTAQRWVSVGGPGLRSCSWHSSSYHCCVNMYGSSTFHLIGFKAAADSEYLTGSLEGSFGLPYEPLQMVWSPCGSRLAVSFKGRPIVGMIETQSSNGEGMYALGFIKGDDDFVQAEQLQFKPVYKKGALLTILWRNGKVSFVPILKNQ